MRHAISRRQFLASAAAPLAAAKPARLIVDTHLEVWLRVVSARSAAGAREIPVPSRIVARVRLAGRHNGNEKNNCPDDGMLIIAARNHHSQFTPGVFLRKYNRDHAGCFRSAFVGEGRYQTRTTGIVQPQIAGSLISYSYRNAIIGSTRAARRAGKKQAAIPAMSTTEITATIVAGS